MGQENNSAVNPFSQSSLMSGSDADKKAKAAIEWAQAMSKPDAGWWTKLTHELPLDIAEMNVNGGWLKEDKGEDRRKYLLEQYKASQGGGPKMSDADSEAWTLLLTKGQY